MTVRKQNTKPLTVQFVRKASEAGKYIDAGRMGLVLFVRSATSKSWVQQIYINGKRRNLGLGSTKFVSLKEARCKALENQMAARTGRWEEKKKAITFKQAALETIEFNKGNWRNDSKTFDSWNSTLAQYVFPIIGDVNVSELKTADILKVLKPIWNEKRPTARKVKHRITTVLERSVAEGHCTENVASAVSAALPKSGYSGQHQRALHFSKVQQAISLIHNSSTNEVIKLAIEFAILTACRSQEVRKARRQEIDFKKRTWEIPAERMGKTGIAHKVPLSGRCIVILKRARELAVNDLIFPSGKGKVLRDYVLSGLLLNLKIDGTVHGFRSSFRDWAAENTDVPHEICEFALAHIEGSGTVKAYLRTDYFKKRRSLMQQWADYLAD